MTALAEDPTAILVLGIIAEAVLAAMLVSSRRGVLLWPMGGVLALVVLGVVLERLIVTERERVEAALHGAAAAMEANDRQRTASFIARSASEWLRRALYYMDRVKFHQIRLRGVEITINELTSPPTAEATFFGTAHYEDRQGEYPYGTYQSRFRVTLIREGGDWKVKDVEGDYLKPIEGGWW